MPDIAAAPFIPLAEPWLPDACAQAVAAQVRSTFVGPGAAAQRFADGLAAICGVHAAVTVASGSVALSMAALVLKLKAQDEVIIPAYGVISVINAIAAIGLTPRLVDIDPTTGNLDPGALKAAISARTKAVVFIDFCGSIGPELDSVADICREAGVPLIEDAAWALGRGSDGRRGGAFGAISVTSFSVPKLVTTGQGGALLVHDDEQRDAAIRLSDQGDTTWRQTNISRDIGSNLRLSDLSASLGLAQLEHLSDRLARKKRVFDALADAIGEPLFRASDGDPAMQHVVFIEEPAAAIATLRAQGIAAAQPYRPYRDHPPFAHLGQLPTPGADFWGRHALFLPFGLALDETAAVRIGCAVRELNGRFLAPSRRAG